MSYDNKLYVVDATLSRAYRINDDDPSSSSGDYLSIGQISSAFTRMTGIATDGTAFYLVDDQGNDLWKVDPADVSNTSSGYGNVGNLPSSLGTPEGVAFYDNALWVVDDGGNELWKIDPTDPDSETGGFGLIGTFPTDLTSPRGATFYNGDLIVIDDDNNDLWRIDTSNPSNTSGRFGKLITLPSGLSQPSGIAFHKNRFYVIDNNDDDLWLVYPNLAIAESSRDLTGEKGEQGEFGLTGPSATGPEGAKGEKGEQGATSSQQGVISYSTSEYWKLYAYSEDEPTDDPVWTGSAWNPALGVWKYSKSSAASAGDTSHTLWVLEGYNSIDLDDGSRTHTGNTIQAVQRVQYSEDGSSSWHETETDDDNWGRIQNANGTYGPPFPLHGAVEWEILVDFDAPYLDPSNPSFNDTELPSGLNVDDFATLRFEIRPFDEWSNTQWGWRHVRYVDRPGNSWDFAASGVSSTSVDDSYIALYDRFNGLTIGKVDGTQPSWSIPSSQKVSNVLSRFGFRWKLAVSGSGTSANVVRFFGHGGNNEQYRRFALRLLGRRI